jgi:hypothetical protein
MRVKVSVSLAAILASVPVTAARSDEAGVVQTALEATRPIIDLRLRSEAVDQQGLPEDGEALTLRGRLGAETGEAWGLRLLAEAELLWPIVADYNDTLNGRAQFPVVADPETYEINRLQIANTSIPGTTVILGRQRINLDDQRFIGSVGWRQNEQTLDALRVTNKSVRNLVIDVAYVDQVNRIVGHDSPVGRYTGDSYLVNLACVTPIGKLTGFAYLLDFEEAPADSSSTVGLRFAGERAFSQLKLAGVAAYAEQADRAGNPLDYRDDYLAAELAGSFHDWTATMGIEVLEGDGAKGFATPLATLHRYQGWADKFLVTPPNGIDDRYLGLGYSRKEVGLLDSLSVLVTHHRYDADRGTMEYGSETNIQVQAKWKQFAGVLKYADYRAADFATDTRKFWIQVEYVL